VTPPPPPPPPPPPSGFDTAEYRASGAASQASAITAYQAGATGSGVIAAVIDSGVNAGSPEFAGRVHPNSGDISGNRGVGDDGGHGTAVSSVLLGAKNDSISHGVAFNATLLSLRTDTPGSCNSTDPGEGCSHDDNNIARAVDAARTTGAKVVNLSLGGSPANANLRAAIDRATAAGIIFVISAGNDATLTRLLLPTPTCSR
jgi:subtilisin family serine protease